MKLNITEMTNIPPIIKLTAILGISSSLAILFMCLILGMISISFSYIDTTEAETQLKIATINAKSKDLSPTSAEAFIDSLYNMDRLPTNVVKRLDSLYYKDKAQREFVKNNFK